MQQKAVDHISGRDSCQ